MREASYTQSFRCLMKRAPQYKDIGCNPFSGRLTHSTRQMREHKTVSPNYRRLSTSTIVFVRRKDLREMMLKLSDVCDCDEQLSWIIFGCAFCFFLKRRRRNDFLDRRLDVVVIDGCEFGVVCYCCWNRFGLATVISVEDVQSCLLTKWSSSDSELLFVCAALRVLDVWWRLNILAQLLQSAFPFYCWNSNNWKD